MHKTAQAPAWRNTLKTKTRENDSCWEKGSDIVCSFHTPEEDHTFKNILVALVGNDGKNKQINKQKVGWVKKWGWILEKLKNKC